MMEMEKLRGLVEVGRNDCRGQNNRSTHIEWKDDGRRLGR